MSEILVIHIRLMKTFKRTDSIAHIKHQCTLFPAGLIMSDSVACQSTKVNSLSFKTVGHLESSLQWILTKDMQAYKNQLTQQLKKNGLFSKETVFVELILERQHEDENFSKTIIFSDKAHFHLAMLKSITITLGGGGQYIIR